MNSFLIIFPTGRSLNLSDPLKLRCFSETERTVLVANHLLGKLAPSSCYLIDKNCIGEKGDHCFCGEDSCQMTGHYGDTSIGEKIDMSVRHIVQTLQHATTLHAHCTLASRSLHDSHETLHGLYETILAWFSHETVYTHFKRLSYRIPRKK